jgi:hypothetical protein
MLLNELCVLVYCLLFILNLETEKGTKIKTNQARWLARLGKMVQKQRGKYQSNVLKLLINYKFWGDKILANLTYLFAAGVFRKLECDGSLCRILEYCHWTWQRFLLIPWTPRPLIPSIRKLEGMSHLDGRSVCGCCQSLPRICILGRPQLLLCTSEHTIIVAFKWRFVSENINTLLPCVDWMWVWTYLQSITAPI